MKKTDFNKLNVNDVVEVIDIGTLLLDEDFMIGLDRGLIRATTKHEKLDGIGLCILYRSEFHLSNKKVKVTDVSRRDVHSSGDCLGTISVTLDDKEYKLNRYGIK